MFETLLKGPSVHELIAAGYLVPFRVYAPSAPDLESLRVRRGDYVERELAERMDRPKLVGETITHAQKHSRGRRKVVFASGVQHSRHICHEASVQGIRAEHLDGTTPTDERAAILRRFEAGQVDLISNAAVLTEGWDCPSADCLILARPTKSLPLYLQMVGRVLRPAPGKTDALILDHAGATIMHGLPDDDIAWALSSDTRATNTTHSRRGTAGKPGLTTCPECHAIRLQGQPCSICGWRPRAKAQAVTFIDGDLGEVRPDRTVLQQRLDQRQVFGELLGIAREFGYRRGWASHKYRERFGDWPNFRNVIPMAPSPELRAWVRSRQIAFAKAREKVAS